MLDFVSGSSWICFRSNNGSNNHSLAAQMVPRHDVVHPHKRKGFWYLIRRVPREFATYDDREIVYVATGIRILDDPRGFKAQQAVEQPDAELVRYWMDKRAGRDPDAEARYERARKTAQQLGFSYAPAREAASGLPVEEILRRIETLEARGTVDRAPEVSAVLGGEQTPVIMISSMVDEFERIVAASLLLKSERQRKKWRVPKDTALATFMDVIGGDRPINALTRTHTLAFRSFWQERIVSGEVEIDTANKSIGRVSSIYRAIN